MFPPKFINENISESEVKLRRINYAIRNNRPELFENEIPDELLEEDNTVNKAILGE